MTDYEQAAPRKLVMEPEQIKSLKAKGMTDAHLEEMLMVHVIKNAIEEQLATPNGDGSYTIILDGQRTVDALVKTIAYYMGMSRGFDKPEDLVTAVGGIAEMLIREVCYSRQAFKEMGPFDSIHVIDSDDPGISDAVN